MSYRRVRARRDQVLVEQRTVGLGRSSEDDQNPLRIGASAARARGRLQRFGFDEALHFIVRDDRVPAQRALLPCFSHLGQAKP